MTYCLLCPFTGPPTIQLDSEIADGVTAKAGDNLKLKAYITGKPLPKISWRINGKELASNAQVKIHFFYWEILLSSDIINYVISDRT